MKRVLSVVISLLLICIVVGVVIVIPKSNTGSSLIDSSTLSLLENKSVSTIDTSRLAAGVIPPTNKWFSGIALQREPKTVFPTPLAFKPSDNGFSYGLTSVSASERTVMAEDRSIMSIVIPDAVRYRITRYDELSVDLTYYTEADRKLVVVTIAAGIPYIFLSGMADGLTLTSSVPLDGKGNYVYKNVLYTSSGLAPNEGALAATGEDATLFAATSSESESSLRTNAENRIAGGSVDFEQQGDDFVTSLSYQTTGGDTFMGYLPHHKIEDESVFSHDTIYGSQKFVSGKKFTFKTSTLDLRDKLDLSNITDDQRTTLITILRREINATEFKAIDTYFGGKELYRSAQLLQLAYQLDQAEIANTIQRKITSEFRLWFAESNGRKEKHFYFDTKTKTIVGEQTSFGSQDSNDHHFHYGYFIYAASVLAQHDKSFLEEYGKKIDLLAADIANYNTDEAIPLRRMFDPYFGHSWASGSSPFDDGNNQESSSEAINAWVGTGLWSQIRGDGVLEEQSKWMLSQEVNAMQSYWLSDEKPDIASRYGHDVFSLNWGGKRDYATFFSDESAAKLGILLIPLNPTIQQSTVLIRDRIGSQLSEVKSNSNPDIYNFEDYLLMYRALHNSTSDYLADTLEFDQKKIDGANSRSYMYAWMLNAKKD